MHPGRVFFVHLLMHFFPPTRLFGLKRRLLVWAGAKLDDNVRIVSTARFNVGEPIAIGADSWIGHEFLAVGGKAQIQIGRDVDIGPRVMIVTGTHELFGSEGKAAGPGYSKGVKVGNGVWIGAGVTILPGVEIGDRAMIASGATVCDNIPSDIRAGGVPAKPLKDALR